MTAALDGHVAVVTINRPPHNFVSVEFMKDLADACEAADADDNVRAIVLQADGKSFCAGADFQASDDRVAAGMEGVNALYVHAVRLYSIEKPIVAAVQGAAVGAGLGLALVADFRVVSPEARFAANFVKLGFHPGFGISLALPRIVGEQKAALMMLTGRRIKGEEALAWGLADDMVEADALRGAALALAREIAENAPLAVVSTRKTLRGSLAAAIKAQTDIEHREQSVLRATEDFQEGIRSVNERRPGNFKGR
ncbi:enoyl-CoA hydratase/isomerase family protein [Phenylobacterium soli]|uniref:enoyl-CoA hydratase/isomerase family protein n=1 Tax=Phenylobacterium soli TaxID=2170551 RepID=UPI001D036344|nr:enoyl-CoA hydratase/isomerase family protein [Phenylobacterium soli]